MFGHQVGKEGAGTNGEIGIQVYTLLIESVSDARDAGNVDLIPGSGRSPWSRRNCVSTLILWVDVKLQENTNLEEEPLAPQLLEAFSPFSQP